MDNDASEKQYTEDEVRDALRAQFPNGSMAAWSRKQNLNQSHVSKMMRGDLAISENLANRAGFSRRVHFVTCKDFADDA